MYLQAKIWLFERLLPSEASLAFFSAGVISKFRKPGGDNIESWWGNILIPLWKKEWLGNSLIFKILELRGVFTIFTLYHKNPFLKGFPVCWKTSVYLNYTRHGSYGSSDTIQNELQQELLYISWPYFIHG